MKKRDVTIALADSLSLISFDNKRIVSKLAEDYTSTDSSNKDTEDAYDMHTRLIKHELLAAQHSYIKKEFDESKKGLDLALAGMGVDYKSIAGETKTLYHADGIKFSKRQNKDGNTTSLTDVLTQLACLGVEKAIVDKACSNANKPKKGNTYYIIEADD
jgi:hypothetical protein|tara:strand:- start:13580 stop:14056 length:477 start_codon:yes stop_codon:yes gene_type:complete